MCGSDSKLALRATVLTVHVWWHGPMIGPLAFVLPYKSDDICPLGRALVGCIVVSVLFSFSYYQATRLSVTRRKIPCTTGIPFSSLKYIFITLRNVFILFGDVRYVWWHGPMHWPVGIFMLPYKSVDTGNIILNNIIR